MGVLTTIETINNNYNNLIQQHCACNNTARAQGKQHYTILPNTTPHYTGQWAMGEEAMGVLTTMVTINNNYNNLIQQHCACNNTARAQGKQHYTILHHTTQGNGRGGDKARNTTLHHTTQPYTILHHTTQHYTTKKQQYYEKNIYHYYPMYRGHGRCYCTDTLDRTNHQS